MNYNNYQPQQHHQQHHQQHQHHQPQHHQQQSINGGFNATSNKLITPPEGCKTLWAGDLHGCDDNYVKSMFSHVGEVISVKLIKDKVTQQPMGYGFIEFATPYQAQVALSLNGTTVGYTGRFYRLNWAKNIPNQNQSQVQHAPSHHQQAPQRQHSNPHMRQNPMHGNPNMGKGQYMQPQMKQPMYHPQHMVPQQPQIMQSPSVIYQPQMMHQPRGHYQQQTYQPRQPRQPSSQSLQDTTEMGEYSVFVGDLSPEVNDFMLRQAFQRYKSLATARVIFDPNNHLSKMYGFVSFNDANDYHSALANMGGTYIGSRPIKVNTAKKEKSHLEAQLMQKQQGFQPTTGTLPTPSPTGHKTFSNMSLNLNNQSRDAEDPNNKVLFIGALGGETTEEDLYRVFSAYGEIRACKISLNKDCGFVEYYSRDDAKKAFILDGTILDSKKIFINWANNPELKTNNTRFKNYREERINNQIPIPMIQRQPNFQEPYDVDLANQYFLDNNYVSVSPFPHDYISTVVPSRNNYQNYYY